jgi:hypothetical protein
VIATEETGIESPAPATHRIALPGGAWMLWRTAVLRGAGLPATTVLSLAAPALAAAADRLLAAEAEVAARRDQAIGAVNAALDGLHQNGEPVDKAQHALLLRTVQALKKGQVPAVLPECLPPGEIELLEWSRTQAVLRQTELRSVHEAAVARNSAELERIAGWDLFREAVVWQNRETVGLALDGLRGNGEGSSRNSRRRQREEMVASYLQRYSVKNDTIGFFGPVGWAELSTGGPPVSVRPGPTLLNRREVYFETWCLEALAERFARDLSLRPWLAPRLRRGLALLGSNLYLPGRKALSLDPVQVRILAASDGQRTARALAAELVADPSTPFTGEEEVFQGLQALCNLGALVWTLEVPLALHPERTLRGLLERIEAAAPRSEALAALDELEGLRGQIARAAGDPPALETAMSELEASFTRLTGAAPRRHHGKLYAARGLVYEECRRDVEVSLGPQVLAALSTPLTLVLESARWLTADLTRRFEARLGEIHAAMQAENPAATIDSSLFFLRVFSTVFGPGQADRYLVEARREFRERWARVLALGPEADGAAVHRSSAELMPRFQAEFAGGGPSWGLVRYFSPDIMVAARSEEAFQAGDFQAVLGEIHPTNTLSWSCFVTQHPHPEEVLRLLAHDLGGETLLVPQFPRSRWVQRMNVHLVLPHFLRYELIEQGPIHPPCRSLPAGLATVREVGGRMRVETRDGKLTFPACELFALPLTEQCSHILGSLLPSSPHRPRVTLDDFVVARESWQFPLSEVGFAGLHDPCERFLAVRRWARRHGLPRHCFYKVPQERKPCYLDLDSPIYVDLFAKLVRGGRGGEEGLLTVAEMLPDLSQTWLTDAQRQRYTCELRLVAIEEVGRSA